MVSAQMGDAQAYRRLIDELYQWFRRYYARRLPYDAAEETAQEALLAVHAKRHTYTSSRPFGPWVLAIARYKWVDRIREIKKANIVCLGNDIAVPDHGSAVAARIAVSGLLKKLKPGQAEAIRIVRLQGDTIEGAALRTGQSEALVKVNVHRGMKKLSAMLNIQSGQS
jgi:RNA polymerase sigma-70 factor (ECF subfamily)